MRAALSLFGLLLLGCTAEPLAPELVETASGEIVNGQPTTLDPAVVGLTFQGQTFCTATLITPSIVLTAAHCLPPFNPVPANQIEVLFGTGPVIDELIATHDAWSHPGWTEPDLPDDIGLLQMKAIASATPIPLNTTQVLQNADVRVVGFGTTVSMGNDSGTKREGTGRVAGQDAAIIYIDGNPSVTCSGDSGGPTFVTTPNGEAIAGIHSRSDCFAQSLDTRVDAYMPEIQDFINNHPEPTCDADGLCAAPCEDGSVDPDCPCVEDGQCTTACPTPSDDPDCDEACGPDGTCIENCGFPDPDCPSCGPDGECVPNCGPPDPDCATEPECDPLTECCDANCEEEADEDPLTLEQGCGCHVVGSPASRHGVWLLVALALTGGRRLRRTRGTRRDRPALR